MNILHFLHSCLSSKFRWDKCCGVLTSLALMQHLFRRFPLFFSCCFAIFEASSEEGSGALWGGRMWPEGSGVWKESRRLQQADWAGKRLLAGCWAVPSRHFNFLPSLASDSLTLLTFGEHWSSAVLHQESKTQNKFCWRIVREVIAAFNLLDLLAEVHVGRYFGSSFMLAFLCSLKLCSRYLVQPDPCPLWRQPQDRLLT